MTVLVRWKKKEVITNSILACLDITGGTGEGF